MRHNRALAGKLATWRDLSPAEQAAIRAHAAHCPSCSKRLMVAEQQDRLLGAMPVLTSRFAFADVRDRVALSRGPLVPQRAFAAIMALLVFLGLGAGAVAASGDSLPGDLLYPLKRGAEATRMWITPGDAAREELASRFAVQRRTEAEALLSLNRSAVMDIEGVLTDVRGHDWALSGITVTVPPALWSGEPPAVGQRVELRIEIQEHVARALAVRLTPGDGPSGGPRQPDSGAGTLAAEPDNSVPGPAGLPREETPSYGRSTTIEPQDSTVVPQPTGTPAQSRTATQPAGAPSAPAATPVGRPTIGTVAPDMTPGPTGSPASDPASPTQTPAGAPNPHPGGGGR